MNDFELIDRLGPDAHAPSEATLAGARARLDAAITQSTSGPTNASRAGRHKRRLPLLVAAAVATIAGASIAIAPAIVGSDDSIALAAVAPLTFPLTPTWLPAGVGEPVFSGEPQPGLRMARYNANGDDRISVSMMEPGRSFDGGDTAQEVDVNGEPGRAFDSRGDEPSEPSYTVQWELGDDEIAVTGKGSFADPKLVERVADSVRQDSQQVDLFLTIAPSGWRVFGFQSDHHVTYYDPEVEQQGEGTDLTLCLCPEADADFDAYGARGVHEVSIDRRPGRIGHTVDENGERVSWVLQSTAPDGRFFSLTAPGALTEEQVLEIAAGVRHS